LWGFGLSVILARALDFAPGMAGGLLITGLLMFMAGVGLNAGGGIVEIIRSAGPQLICAGIIVTLVPPCSGPSLELAQESSKNSLLTVPYFCATGMLCILLRMALRLCLDKTCLSQ
jgi:hypothetical protein